MKARLICSYQVDFGTRAFTASAPFKPSALAKFTEQYEISNEPFDHSAQRDPSLKTIETELDPRPVGPPSVAVPPMGHKMAVDRAFAFCDRKKATAAAASVNLITSFRIRALLASPGHAMISF
jgi:hypothetical protein